MGEPGGLPSVGSHRVGHDWSNLAAAAELGEVSEISFNDTLKYMQPPKFYYPSFFLSNFIYFGCAGPSLLQQGFL